MRGERGERHEEVCRAEEPCKRACLRAVSRTRPHVQWKKQRLGKVHSMAQEDIIGCGRLGWGWGRVTPEAQSHCSSYLLSHLSNPARLGFSSKARQAGVRVWCAGGVWARAVRGKLETQGPTGLPEPTEGWENRSACRPTTTGEGPRK